MANDYLQESLQTFSSMFNHIIAKSVREDLAGKWRYGNAGRLTLENVSKIFKVGVASTNDRVTELKCWNVGSGMNFIGGVHVSRRRAMCLRILYLDFATCQDTAVSMDWGFKLQ